MADQSAVARLRAARGLEDALRLGGGARRHIGGARAGRAAGRRAERALDASDGHLLLVGLARAGERVAVVAAAWRRGRRGRGRGRRARRRGRRRAGARLRVEAVVGEGVGVVEAAEVEVVLFWLRLEPVNKSWACCSIFFSSSCVLFGCANGHVVLTQVTS